MAKWSGATNNLTPVAVADTTNYTDNGYYALQGGSSTQQLRVLELYIGGLGTGSSASGMQLTFGRDSTIGATLSGAHQAALDPATAALAAPMVTFQVATTKPQRSATLGYLLTPAFSGNGGIVRWVAAPGEEIVLLGNTASFGEASLSCVGGTITAVSSHLIFEPL